MENPERKKPTTAKDVLIELRRVILDQNKSINKNSVITTIATLVIAIATVANLGVTHCMLSQMQTQTDQAQIAIDLQGNYYEKTVRPFVYPDSILLKDFEPADSTYLIYYSVKNVGSLPAKEVRINLDLGTIEDEKYEVSFPPIGIIMSLFPGQATWVRYRMGRISIAKLQRHPYIYVFLEFKDAGDKEYRFKSIYYLDHRSFDPYRYSISPTKVDFD